VHNLHVICPLALDPKRQVYWKARITS
jgi:hypothetical protein